MALPDGWGDLTIDDLSAELRGAPGPRTRPQQSTELRPM